MSNFNTSHVVVYQVVPDTTAQIFYFNTSHVVVYQEENTIYKRWVQKFQYISCCSLSRLIHQFCSIVFSFQYISCCSLSILFDGNVFGKVYFNTSHVVVYQGMNKEAIMKLCSFQYISCCSLSKASLKQQLQKRYFNTSHVVVYQTLQMEI